MVPFICRLLARALIRRLPPTFPTGLRLLVRALLSGSEPDESSSIGGGDVTRCLRVAERVTGPK
jgi:hypothetical protein